jgi:hypothetical protein
MHMNTTKSTHDMPLECARLNTTKDDEAFLQRIDRALSAAPAIPSPRRKPRYAIIGSLAAAAAIVVIGGTMLVNRSLQDKATEYTHVDVVAGGVVLKTDLPPELIEGTSKPISVPGLLPLVSSPPTLMVPEGTRLLSRGKPVTSSDESPIIGSLDCITDGDKDAGEGYFVELLDGLQWVQIDLEQHADIQAVWVWHFHSQWQRAYHDVIVQVSDDPEFKQGVTTVYNNDYDNSARMGKGVDRPYAETRYGLLVNAKGTPGRYIRLYSNGNTSNELSHYIEVEAFGTTR